MTNATNDHFLRHKIYKNNARENKVSSSPVKMAAHSLLQQYKKNHCKKTKKNKCAKFDITFIDLNC